MLSIRRTWTLESFYTNVVLVRVWSVVDFVFVTDWRIRDLRVDRSLFLQRQMRLFQRYIVLSLGEGLFLTTENDGCIRTVMSNFWHPLVRDVREWSWTDDAEAKHEHIGLWVGQRAKSIIIFLASRIPKSQGHFHVINNNIGSIIIKASQMKKAWSIFWRSRSEDHPYTVGTYSSGKVLLVKDISIHVLPTVPSPTMTNLIGTLWWGFNLFAMGSNKHTTKSIDSSARFYLGQQTENIYNVIWTVDQNISQ